MKSKFTSLALLALLAVLTVYVPSFVTPSQASPSSTRVITIDGDISDWAGIAPIATDPLGDTEPWSKNVTLLAIGNTSEPADMVPLNDKCRDLEAFYMWSDTDWIYFRLDVNELYEGFNETSLKPPYTSPYPNVTVYEFYFDVDGIKSQEGVGEHGVEKTQAATDIDMNTVAGQAWDWHLQCNGNSSYAALCAPPYSEQPFPGLSSGTGLLWAVDLANSAIEFALNRTALEAQVGVGPGGWSYISELGIQNILVFSWKPGEPTGQWGNWIHAFDPQAPGTAGEVWGAPGPSPPNCPYIYSDHADYFEVMGTIGDPPSAYTTSGYEGPCFAINLAPGAKVELVDASTGKETISNEYLKGQTFTLNITVWEAINLANWTIGLSWNASILNCTAFNPIDEFFARDVTILGTINNTVGKIDPPYSANTTTPVNGTGTLAQVTFKVLDYGETWINLTARLLNSSGVEIHYPVGNLWFELTPPKAPTADFIYSPQHPAPGQTITFNASISKPGWNGTADVSIANYTWNFGDGSSPVTENDPVTTHSYAIAGTYTVNLTVMCEDDPVLIYYNITSGITSKTVKVGLYDVAVLSVTPSPTEVTVGEIVNVNVMVKNNGSFTEAFDVTAYRNTTTISTQTVSLASGANTTLTFTWNTTGATPGVYTIKAVAETLPGETHTADNERVADDMVTVKGAAHDVAVISVSPDKTEVTVGETVTITVVVKNNGTVPENFTVTAYYDTSEIDTQSVINLDANDTETLTFTWNTTGVAAGNYTIKAKATLEGDTYPDNDELTATQTVTVKEKPGPPIPIWVWIIIGVVVVIIIIAIVYMLKRKKPSATS
jgi:hypothetical protein